MTWSRRRRLASVSFFGGAILFASLVTAGSPPAHAVTSGTGTQTLETCPLTGKSASIKTARRPAVAVRVSNSPDARPQIGIGTADLIIETPTEGGTTRLIAFFHCSSEKTAGPVRSARMDDPAIVAPISKLFAFSGANATVMNELEAGALTNVTEATPDDAIYRTPSDSTDVDSVRADVAALRSLARTAGLGKPSSPFGFGKVHRSGSSASSITMGFGSTSVGYRWRSGSWIRSQDGVTFRDTSGSPVKTTNVLIQEVETNASTSLFDSNGVASPRFELVGSGRAFLFRNGQVVKGTWTDAGPGAPIFRTKSGADMKLARGRTWLEMVPSPDGDLPGTIAYS